MSWLCLESYCVVSTLPLLFVMCKQTLLRDSGTEELDFSLLFSETFLRHLFWAHFHQPTSFGLLIVDRQHDPYGIFKNKFQFYFLVCDNFQN